MKAVFAGILGVFLVIVLYFGQNHWNNNISKASKEGEKYNQQLKLEEKKQYDAAKKTWLGKVEPRVYVIGSSVAAGVGSSDVTKTSWSGLLHQAFLTTNSDVDFVNLGVGGYTTKDIIDNHITDKIVEPDVVIFETCLLNNYTKFTVSDSKSQIKNIYDNIHKKYPNARIILMPSEPQTRVDIDKDNEGHTYRQYVNNIGDYVKSQDWNYIDFWGNYESTVKNSGNTLSSVLNDGVHPNDTGYKIWFDSIKEYFGIKN